MFRTFRGGIRFELTGNSARTSTIRRFDESKTLLISMDQGAGLCEPTVAPGDRVLKYQKIGSPVDPKGLAVYSPVSGRVEAVEPRPHPFLGSCLTVVVSDNGQGEARPLEKVPEGVEPPRDFLVELAHVAAIPGPIQYSEPEYIRMQKMISRGVRTLVCGAVECEPYQAHEARICAQYAHEVVGGLLLMLRAVCAQEAVVAFSAMTPEAERAIRKELRSRRQAGEDTPVRVARVAAKYPASHKLKTIFETPGLRFGERPIPAGVTSPFACLSLYRAVTEGRPVTDVFVTVSGSAVERPNVYEMPIGTSMEDVLRRCAATESLRSIVMGGVMNGLALDGWEYPILRCNNTLLALAETTEFSRADDCIHCNRCGKVCPEGLSPSQICEYLLQGDQKEAESLGLKDCRLCGCCTYICPGRVELTEILKNGKKAMEL